LDDDDCPCGDPSWCDPIQIPLYNRSEVYAFSLSTENWKHYDWSVITTVAHSFVDLTREWVCFAHQHNARVVFTTGIPSAILQNTTAKEQKLLWVQDLVDRVQRVGADGLNIDFEEEVAEDDSYTQAALVYVTSQIQISLKSRNPYSSLVW
jgi:hypothetical protein